MTTTLILILILAAVSFTAGALWMHSKIDAMIEAAILKIATPSQAVMAVVARSLREVEEVKSAAQCRITRDEAASKAGDNEATLRRIMRAMDIQTWPNNMDLAGCVESMMGQYRSNMTENANLRHRLQQIESCTAA